MDALRTFAVLGMMAAHTSRLITQDARPTWSKWVLLLEPLIPSLFLLLVGLSLSLSREASRLRGQSSGTWYVRQLKRAAVLWVISAVFFSLELGVRLPDALTASGILANIAYAIVIVGGLLVLPGRGIFLALAWIVGICVFTWLDAAGHRMFPVNLGNAPFLPLWLFAMAGALWGSTFGSAPTGRAAHGPPVRWLIPTIGVLAGLIAIWLIARYGIDALFTKPLGRSDAGRLTAAPIHGGEPLQVAYYNLRPILALACLSLQIAMLTLFGTILKSIKEGAATVVFALGRHALGAYILHLALLAVLVVLGGRQPLSAGWQGVFVWIAVATICLIWAIFREKPSKNR
jgi:hypothetical protein